uniref:Uncharacterized protein n=1 Tax=Cacopsylla melanoneura TaxID=428564 RepID=A0A8D8WIS1_9HEMI
MSDHDQNHMLVAPKPYPSLVASKPYPSLVATKPYPSLISITSHEYSNDSTLNPKPWYNDFVYEDPPEDYAPRKPLPSETVPPQPSPRKITCDVKHETCKVACEEGIADKTSLELIQEISDKIFRNDEKACFTDSEISVDTGKPKQRYAIDTNGIQKLSVSENQMSSVGNERISEDLRDWLMNTTLEEFDERIRPISREKQLTSMNTEESVKQSIVHPEPNYFPDKDRKANSLLKPGKRTKNKPQGTVNILENNIRIKRTKDKKDYRIKLVSPNTTIGDGFAMTTVNNSVTMGTRSSATMTTKHSVTMTTEPVMAVGQLCEEYVLTEKVLREAVSSRRGYLNLIRRNNEIEG